MSIVYVVLINIILLFIVYLVLNHKINKNSTSALLDRYAREVENLIVELNRTLDEVLNLSEERVGELKRLVKKAEKAIAADRQAPAQAEAGDRKTRLPRMAGAREPEPAGKPVASRAVARDSADSSETAHGEGAPNSVARGAGAPGQNNPDASARSPAPAKARVTGGPQAARHLYDVRGKRVEAAVGEQPRENARPPNIFERSRHLLSMGHSKDEIARMLNLSRAEMDFLASLHNK